MTTESRVAAIILAAGQGKRMKSDLPKVLHTVGNQPLVEHVIRQARSVSAEPVIVVVGHGRELVIPVVTSAGAEYAVQEEQLGTGHAVRCAGSKLNGYDGNVLILSGDVPLLSRETLQNVIEYHVRSGATATVVTAIAPDPTGYGRVIRSETGDVVAIREHKDCSPEERAIDEINSGIYVFKSHALFEALEKVRNDNAQKEYYLPDVFQQYFGEGVKVSAVVGAFAEIQGINTPEDLARAREIFESSVIAAKS